MKTTMIYHYTLIETAEVKKTDDPVIPFLDISLTILKLQIDNNKVILPPNMIQLTCTQPKMLKTFPKIRCKVLGCFLSAFDIL